MDLSPGRQSEFFSWPIAAAVAGHFENQLRAELERAATALLAKGMPLAQVQQLLDAAAEMHAGQVALIERKVGGSLGQRVPIH